MKNNISGFMLIELIVASLIASLLSAVLLTALSQSTKVQTSIDNTVDISERIAILVGQLEKDLAGAFVPVQSSFAKASQNRAEKPDAAESMGKPDSAQSSDKKSDKPSDKGEQKKEPKPIEKIFYSTNKDGKLDTLTFVTNNPLVVFVGKDVGTVKPKVVRVQYTLKPEAGSKTSFALYRQESNELDLAEYKNVRPYEVIRGIKKLSATYTARLEKKEESSAKKSSEGSAKDKPKKSYEYKVQPDWVSEKKEEKKKVDQKDGKEEQEFPRIPYSVEFKVALWDKNNKKDKDFTFICAIPVDSIEAQLNDEEPAQKPAKKEEPKKAAPEDESNQKSDPTGPKVAMSGQVVKTEEVFVYEGSEALNKAMGSLKNLLGRV